MLDKKVVELLNQQVNKELIGCLDFETILYEE